MKKLLLCLCCSMFSNSFAMMNTNPRLAGFRDQWYAQLAQEKQEKQKREENLEATLTNAQREILHLTLENLYLKRLLKEHGVPYEKSGEEYEEQKNHVNHIDE